MLVVVVCRNVVSPSADGVTVYPWRDSGLGSHGMVFAFANSNHNVVGEGRSATRRATTLVVAGALEDKTSKPGPQIRVMTEPAETVQCSIMRVDVQNCTYSTVLCTVAFSRRIGRAVGRQVLAGSGRECSAAQAV